MAQQADLVVVTCASGNQSTPLIPLLCEKVQVRLVVRSQESAKRLQKQYPHAEVIQAEMASPADCERILQGASTVYWVGPSIHPHEKETGLNMVDAAVAESQKQNSSFKHFVMSSVLNSQLRKMFNHDDKRYVEEYLIESGLNFTILQPGDFLDYSFPVKAWLATDEPAVRPMVLSGNAKSSLVVLKDLAEASAKVILERERHYQAQYPLVSFGPITYSEVTEQVAKAMGKPIEQKPVSVEEGADMMMQGIFGSTHVPTRSRDKAERLVLFYQRRGLQGNSNVLEWLLGRKPTSISEWVEAQSREVRSVK